MKKVYLLVGTIGMLAMLAMPGWSLSATAAPSEIISGRQAAQNVDVANVKTRGDVVSGVLINESPEIARDVQLVIRQTWFWNDEFHPGPVSPGRAEFYTVHTEIPPHGSAAFTYDTGPLPQRTDGHFETYVQVVWYTEVGAGATSTGAAAAPLPSGSRWSGATNASY